MLLLFHGARLNRIFRSLRIYEGRKQLRSPCAKQQHSYSRHVPLLLVKICRPFTEMAFDQLKVRDCWTARNRVACAVLGCRKLPQGVFI